ncbi:MAG: hypothetical protein COT89_00420 [Candidatus Colwellbacteria bacterium CG10_big_fil_rev_8_21_14_0_10_42_22]|uniref:Uncharacterized protein n=1 Tax=Candidatus Colwellbacteria bacterium CG10_big_fil_rev_8_21_14_0_10_42_22 TaxID=1974540 RepID=A0A2H0VGD1_9BACT|nr:MAG: hypothetical protein COT89_00420 [Candidatus Colwellbacteria bacterium CG10_big_fil_rev_8_21_14_0_10_42_22]
MKEALLARAEAFIEEFPFLGRYIRVKQLHKRPIVQRVDLDLLDRVGCTETRKRKSGGGLGDLRFFLISADGSELMSLRQKDSIRSTFKIWRPGTWISHSVDGETVYEGIQRLDNPELVAYVLEISDLLPNSRGKVDEPDFGVEVVLHKVPSGTAFSNWLKRLREVAADELSQEIDELNQT